jgi:release factor glutamine methyltransferase
MGIELLFDPGVCLVRPETEILGEATVSFLRERGKTSDQLRMIDVGCGSGNLTCGVAASVKSLHVWSVDISSKCIALTSKNVIQCGLTDRVKVAQGDLFEPLESNELYGQIDAIVCNPPYIASNRLKGDRSFLLIHEPHEALDGGPFGFKVQLRLIKDSVRFLRPGCCLLFEFGEGQHNQVRSLIQRTNAYETVNFSFDKLGNPRVAIAQKKA